DARTRQLAQFRPRQAQGLLLLGLFLGAPRLVGRPDVLGGLLGVGPALAAEHPPQLVGILGLQRRLQFLEPLTSRAIPPAGRAGRVAEAEGEHQEHKAGPPETTRMATHKPNPSFHFQAAPATACHTCVRAASSWAGKLAATK